MMTRKWKSEIFGMMESFTVFSEDEANRIVPIGIKAFMRAQPYYEEGYYFAYWSTRGTEQEEHYPGFEERVKKLWPNYTVVENHVLREDEEADLYNFYFSSPGFLEMGW